MIEDGRKFDRMINIALGNRHYDIAEYLKSNLGQFPDALAEILYYGNYDVASYLLSKGADINKKFRIGYCIEDEYCPLCDAIRDHLIEIIKFLIEHGADVNIRLSYLRVYWANSEIPLSIAINENSIEMVKLLVEYGADVNKIHWDRRRKQCPLSDAIKVNSFEIVQFLVEHSADVNMKLEKRYQGISYKCPLSYAIQKNSFEIVKYLVEHGADVNMKLGPNEFPLSIAIKRNLNEITRFLYDHGAKTDQ